MVTRIRRSSHERHTAFDTLESVVRTYTITLRANNCKPTTIRIYLEALRQFTQFCISVGISTHLDDIARNHIRAWISQQIATLSSATAHNRYRSIHRFFEFCVQEGLLEHSPMERMKPPKLDERIVRPYTEDETQKLLSAHSGKSWLELRDVAVILFLVDTGARAAEALGITWADVDFDTGRAGLWGKGGVERIVRMGFQAQLALDRYRRACPYDMPEVWLSKDGRPLSRNGLFLMIKSTGKRVGIKGANIHRLRHTMGTIFLKHGGTRQGLQDILGHKTDYMTRRYTQTVAHEVALKEHEEHSPGDWLRKKGK